MLHNRSGFFISPYFYPVYFQTNLITSISRKNVNKNTIESNNLYYMIEVVWNKFKYVLEKCNKILERSLLIKNLLISTD